MGVGGRRGGRARRARHRRQHRQRRRPHHVHHHHHRTGVRRGARQGARTTFPFLFAAGHRRARARTRTTGGAQATVTADPATTNEPACRAPKCLTALLISVFLVTGMVVAFAVPAVPFPIGITCMVLFVFIIALPFVANVVQSVKARSDAEPDVEAPAPAEELRNAEPGVTGGLNGATVASSVLYGNSTVNMNPGGAYSGQPHAGYSYDPPPSFTEATAPSYQPPEPNAGVVDANDASQGLRPEPPAGYPATEPTTATAATGVPADGPLPPPPTYEEAVGGGTA